MRVHCTPLLFQSIYGSKHVIIEKKMVSFTLHAKNSVYIRAGILFKIGLSFFPTFPVPPLHPGQTYPMRCIRFTRFTSVTRLFSSFSG